MCFWVGGEKKTMFANIARTQGLDYHIVSVQWSKYIVRQVNFENLLVVVAYTHDLPTFPSYYVLKKL